MPDLIPQLESLPDHVADQGQQSSKIWAKGRKRVRRRRALCGSLMVLVLVVGVAIAAVRSDRDPPNGEVVAGPGQTTAEQRSTTVPTTPTTPTNGAPLSVTTDASGPVPDGTTLSASGTGPPGTEIRLAQCLAVEPPNPRAGAWPSIPGVEYHDCDVVRTKHLTIGDGGTFATQFLATAQMTVTTEAGSNQPAVVRCQPCELRVQFLSDGSASAAVPLEVESGPNDVLPSVRIVEPGPHRPSQRVTLEGKGFQIDGDLPELGWCSAIEQAGRADDCATPNEKPTVDVEGSSFRISDFPLPPADYTPTAGVHCTDAPGTCVLATTSGEGTAFVLKVPLDLSG